jgi:response regulator RpfG family c-di-GMP phosphodiesterase
MKQRVLLVDDDPDLLKGLSRGLQKKFDIATAPNGQAALDYVKSEAPFAVAVIDMRMPGMTGLEVLKRMRKLSPDTQRIMLTGNIDQETAVNAVNEGSIFRFFNKPCAVETLTEGIDAAIRQYQFNQIERDLLEKTLAGSVKVLTDVLAMAAPKAFRHSARFREWAKLVAIDLELPQPWQLEIGCMLSPIGYVTLPADIAAKWTAGQPLSEKEQQTVSQLPAAGKRLIGNIPRMEDIAEIVYYQDKGYDGSGFPEDETKEEDIPRGARILKIFKALNEACGLEQPTVHHFAELASDIDQYDLELLYAMQTCLIEGYSRKSAG